MADQSDLHNRLAGPIVAAIVRPVLAAGGSPSDVLMLLESVIVGVCLTMIRLGGDNRVLDIVIDRARARLAEIRLADIKPDGSA